VIYLCIGRRELGKTTLAYYMARKLDKRAIIDARRMVRQGHIRIEYAHSANDADESLFAMVDDNECDEVIYQPHEDDLQQGFDVWTGTLKRIVIDHPQQHLAVLVDEASFYNLDTPTFQWLAKCALRDYVHIIITAHQPKDIPTSIRAIADHWFIFRTTQKTDLDKIAEKSPEAAREAERLTDRSFVWWDDTRAVVSFNRKPASWFIALQARQPSSVQVTPDAERAKTLFDNEV